MDFLQALILGIVEGVTEFLPISSTAHMMIVSEFLKLQQTDFVKSFEIIIQLGAIFAVIAIYIKSILKIKLEDAKKIIFAFIPTAIIGFVLYKFIKSSLMGNNLVIILALLIGGIVLILVEKFRKNKDEVKVSGDENKLIDFSSISYKQSFIIGLCQSIAVIPGVSRSAATIVGGLLMNIERRVIVDFSFLLAIPTMAAATGLDVLKNYKLILSSGNFGVLFVGFIVAFIVAYVVSKWFLKFIKKYDFISFGIYRVLLAIALFIIFFMLK